MAAAAQAYPAHLSGKRQRRGSVGVRRYRRPAMRLNGVKAGDLVLCDVKGRRFHAEVTDTPGDGDLQVRPLTPAVTYRHVTARQVLEHWRKAHRPGPSASADPAPESVVQTLF